QRHHDLPSDGHRRGGEHVALLERVGGLFRGFGPSARTELTDRDPRLAGQQQLAGGPGQRRGRVDREALHHLRLPGVTHRPPRHPAPTPRPRPPAILPPPRLPAFGPPQPPPPLPPAAPGGGGNPLGVLGRRPLRRGPPPPARPNRARELARLAGERQQPRDL